MAMPSLSGRTAAKLAGRLGPLRALPVTRLLLAGELLLMAHEHLMRLSPGERRRVLELVRRGHARRRNLTQSERAELAWLIAKANPREFAGMVAQRFSPVPLPRRLVRGKRRSRVF